MTTMLLTRRAGAKTVPARSVVNSSRLDLSATAFAQVAVSNLVGVGCRCRAFAARGYDQDLILKAYHARSVAKHAQYSGGSLARYEHERNSALRSIPALAGFIAAPLGFVSEPRLELFLQERVFGEPLPAFMRTCSSAAHERLLDDLRMVIEHAHRAGIFDLDLQPSNIIVQRNVDGSARPVLFDFNKIPYHVRPPNPVAGWLMRLGLIDRHSRDYRYWRRLGGLGAKAAPDPRRKIRLASCP